MSDQKLLEEIVATINMLGAAVTNAQGEQGWPLLDHVKRQAIDQALKKMNTHFVEAFSQVKPSPAFTATDEIEAAEVRGAKMQSVLEKGVADGTIKLTDTKPEQNDDWHQPAQKEQA